jgi:hypothetical protein
VLASYNAGERPVHRWMSERPGIARDEFIDDIPYPQTQNYVKKILGTAEDYRRLYGSELIRTDQAVADAASAAAVAPTVPATSVRRVAKKATTSRKSASAAAITRKKKPRKAA